MNIKIKKKLGVGFNGTVFLSEVNGIKSITKVEKFDGDMTTKSNYIRQVKFNELAKQYPEYFLTLVLSGIQENCNHKQPMPKQCDKKCAKEFNKKNDLPQCYILSYVPVLDGTWDSLQRSLSKPLSSKQYCSALFQLITACNILKKHGYRHRDIHSKNIMYKLNGNKYRWYLIDYGAIYHKSFTTNRDDKIYDENPPDILSVLWALANNHIAHHMWENGIKPTPFKQFIKYIQKSDEYTNIKPFLPITKNEVFISECISLVTMINHYDLYMDAMGMDHVKYKKFHTTQDDPNVLLYIIKHCTDKTYNQILTYLKNKI